MIARLLSSVPLGLAIVLGSAAPPVHAQVAHLCPLTSAVAVTDDGKILPNQVPGPVVPPGSTITLTLRFDSSYGLCPSGVQAATFAPDGRHLDRPWSDGGELEYSVRVPFDLRGGVDQTLVITTREENGATPLYSLPFRTDDSGTDRGSVTNLGPGRVIDGRLVLCSDRPDACQSSPAPAAAPDASPTEPATPAAAVSPAAVVAAPDAPPAAPPPTPSTEDQPPPAAAESVEATHAAPASARAPAAPEWLWPGVGIAGALGIALAGGLRILRHRDRVVRMRRMAHKD